MELPYLCCEVAAGLQKQSDGTSVYNPFPAGSCNTLLHPTTGGLSPYEVHTWTFLALNLTPLPMCVLHLRHQQL